MAYHKAVKKICGFKYYDSNHLACDIVGVKIFKHLLASRLICFWTKLCNSQSDCIGSLKYYFKYSSMMSKRLKKMFMDNYQVDIFMNPLCVINSRINFVQKNEPRSAMHTVNNVNA